MHFSNINCKIGFLTASANAFFPRTASKLSVISYLEISVWRVIANLSAL